MMMNKDLRLNYYNKDEKKTWYRKLDSCTIIFLSNKLSLNFDSYNCITVIDVSKLHLLTVVCGLYECNTQCMIIY